MVGFKFGTGCMRPWILVINKVLCRLMVWSVIMCYRSVLLVYLNISLTGNHYVSLVCNHLQPFMNCMYPNNDRLFQKDNALCHLSQVTSAKSQLSICGILEKSICKQNPVPTNSREMVIKKVSLNISPVVFQLLVVSISLQVSVLRWARGLILQDTNPIPWNLAHPYIEANYIKIK